MHTLVVPQTSPLGQSAFVAVPCPFGVWIDVVKDVRLVPPLRVAPPKLQVLLLKTAGVAVHADEVSAAVKLPLLSAKTDAAARRASIATVIVSHFRFSFWLTFSIVTLK